MKHFLLVVSIAISIAFLFLGLVVLTESDGLRLPVYHYPNGYIVNINRNFTQLWGTKFDLLELEIAQELATEYSRNRQSIHVYDEDSSRVLSIDFIHKDKLEIIQDFVPDLAIALCYLIVAIWAFFYTRDVFILLLFGSLSCLIVFNFFMLGFHDFYFLFFYFLYFSGFMIFNVSYRLRGKEIPSGWFAPEILASGLMGFLAHSQKSDGAVFGTIVEYGVHFILLASLLCILLLIFDTFRNPTTLLNFTKKVGLVVGFALLGVLPYTVIQKADLNLLRYSRELFFVSLALFPVLFIFGTYKYSIVPVQIAFSSSFTQLYLFAALLLGYIIYSFIILELDSTFYHRSMDFTNVIFLGLSTLFLITLRNWIRGFLDHWTLRSNPKLNHSLEDMTEKIGSPVSVKATINSLIDSIVGTLAVEKLIVLIPGDKFPKINLRSQDFMLISSTSELWKYFEANTEITVTSHLAYGLGIKESVYNFLNNLDIQIAYPLFNYSNGKQVIAVFLVGEKKDLRNFTLGELRYIRECSRLGSLLIENYTLLIDEVEKKRIVRDLNMASVIDKTLHLEKVEEIPGTKVGYFSVPAVGISGDYLDIVPLSESQLVVSLGDVAGHGLGTGYLVSAIRGVLRGHIGSSKGLPSLFKVINRFLIDRYGGTEFVTLIIGVLDRSKGVFEYINAGHVPIIVMRRRGEFEVWNESQRVLGVIPTEYRVSSIPLEPGDRLILYTDGITETFNPNEEIYGEERFYQLLSSQQEVEPERLSEVVEKRLAIFRSRKELTDDISFICIDIVDKFASKVTSKK